MLIKYGPRCLKPGRDWRIVIVLDEPRVQAIHEDSTFRDELFCDAAARWLGFDVTYGSHGGYITNWDDVPHLWSVADVEP